MEIRLANEDEVPQLPDLERRAGAVFRDIGMADIADGDPTSAAEYGQIQLDGLLWVASSEDGALGGFLAGKILDGCAYIHEISVDPDFAGRKLGRKIIETYCAWAKQKGYPLISLSTFRDVPWNAPYYAKMGFEIVDVASLGPSHQAVRQEEIDGGLDGDQRVFMQRVP